MTRLQDVRWMLARLRKQHLEPAVAEMHPDIWADIQAGYRQETGCTDKKLTGRRVLGVDIDLNTDRLSVVIILRHPAISLCAAIVPLLAA